MAGLLNLRFVLAAGLALAASWAPASASSAAMFMPIGPQVAPPQGFVQFCYRTPGFCTGTAIPIFDGDPVRAANSDFWRQVFNPIEPGSVTQSGPETNASWASRPPSRTESSLPSHANGLLALNEAMWAQLISVNQEVNSLVEPAEDRDLYGRGDYWALPTQKGGRLRGDCEDYVLLKRKILTERIGQDQAFSIALVRTPTGQNHAVLIVNTDAGELVLDNLTPRVMPWFKTRYKLLVRQDPQDGGRWVSAGSAG